MIRMVRLRWTPRSAALAVVLAAACGVDPAGAEETDSPSTVGPMSTDGSTGSSTTPDPETTGGTTSIGTNGDTTSSGRDEGEPQPIDFDLGILPDIGVIEETGCQGIDFLFVIDNSGSMTVQQSQLLNSFPGFIDAIQTSLDNVDSYHVGVITSDNYAGNQPGCTTIGDLVTQTAGFGSSNSVCTPLASGLRFATEEDDLQTVFPCMAQVGTTGSPIEQPVTATVAALDPAKAQPGECNEGFIREDAILVVVIVTDDPPFDFDLDDAHPNTDTSGWYDAVVAAKGGEVESIVMIGFVPTPDNLSCTFGDSPNLVGFIEQFGEQGVLASVCDADYGPIFASTIGTIETTCDNFVPQG